MTDDDDMLPEYDLSHAVQGKHAAMFQRDTVMVTLEPDVAAAFPDADAVNEALRLLLSIKQQLVGAA